MAGKSEDDYGAFGSVPDKVAVNGSGAQPLNVRATPENFGAAVGAGISKVGATAEDITQHYQEMAVHTATNDAYVNGYAPAVNNLVSNYKKLSGTDALQQLPDYQNQLKELNNQYLKMGSPMQQELMGGLVARHTISTMDNMSNHADQQYAQHEQIVTAQGIKQANDEAVNNMQDPAQVDFNVNRAGNLAKSEAARKIGISSDPRDIAAVNQMGDEGKSVVATSVIKAAMDSRNYDAANQYYNKYASILSGAQKLELTKQLTDLNAVNNADNVINNLAVGKQAVTPGTTQANAVEDKASVAALAQKENFDPNIAFALHGAESNYGHGIKPDSRLKDDFQTDPKFRDKGFEDDSLASSMHNGAKIWRENVPVLEQSLGRPAIPSEGYVAYNQGGAGAVALYKAAPNETAVQALSKIMPADEALAHVTKNGGTPTMSASAFTGHLQDWFQTHYDAQKTTIAGDLPSAIRGAAKAQIPAMQQASNPHDYLEQVSANLPNMRAYAATIPDDKTRDIFEKKIDAKYNQAKVDDAAWKVGQAKIASQFGEDPRYTSMDQVPQTVKADLQKAGQLKALETMLTDKNNPKKDATYGAGFLNTMQRLATDDPNDRISNIAELQQAYGENPALHSSGFRTLSSLIKGADTPEGKAKIASQAQFLSDLRQKIGGDTPEARNANLEKAMPLFFNNSAQNPWEMSLDPKNKNSFVARNNIKVMTPAEEVSKKINDSVSTISVLFGAGGDISKLPQFGGGGAVSESGSPRFQKSAQILKEYDSGRITEQQKNSQLAALGTSPSINVPRAE